MLHSSALKTAADETIAKTHSLAESIFAIASSDPGLTHVPDEHKTRHLESGRRYAIGNFSRLYRNASERSDRLEVPDDLDPKDIEAVLDLQGEIDSLLGTMCWKHGTTLGEAVQVDLLRFLDNVEPVLRNAFELNHVEESVRKRTREIFETKGERAKRAKLVEQSQSLTEIE